MTMAMGDHITSTWNAMGGLSDCRVAGLGGKPGLHRGNAPLMVLMFLLTFYSSVVNAGPGLGSSLIMSHPGREGLF